MGQQRRSALAPLTGAAFVVLVSLGLIIGGDRLEVDETPQKILSFYNDNDGEQMFASALLALGTVFLFFFLGVLRAVLRAGEATVSRLSAVAFAGGIVLGTGILALAGFTFVLADAADHLTPDAAQALNTLDSDFFFPVAAGLATLMIATGISALGSKVLPPVLAWIAIALGIFAVTPAGYLAFRAFGAWALATSIWLWQAATRASAPPAPPMDP
jgi:hypothetical protein